MSHRSPWNTLEKTRSGQRYLMTAATAPDDDGNPSRFRLFEAMVEVAIASAYT